jgi:hypothetical protein
VVDSLKAGRPVDWRDARTGYDRPNRGALWSEGRAAGGRYSLRLGSKPHWLVQDKKIAPHIPVIDKSRREDGTFSRDDFTFDKQRNVYTCPAGKTLTTTGRLVNDGETLLYRASMRDCRSCLLKAQCCPKAPFRRVPRSIYEEARDVARVVAKTEAFERSRRDRKRVEMLFAHLKRILRIGRLRLARTARCPVRVHGWRRLPRTCAGWLSSSPGRHRWPPQMWRERQVALALRRQRRRFKTIASTERAATRRQGAIRISHRRLLQQNLPGTDIRAPFQH